MPISFGSSSDTSGVYLRANLPQNRWWVKGEAGDEPPLDMGAGVAIDIKNVVFGWLHIDVGVRDWQPWPSPSQQIPRPSDSHKNGFEVKCWLQDRREAEFSGNSFGLGQFIAKLYNEAEKCPEFETQIPVVQVTSSTPVVIGRGTSYDVGFTIKKWIPRPEAPTEAPVAAPAPQAAPPAQAAPVAPAAAGDDFGF